MFEDATIDYKDVIFLVLLISLYTTLFSIFSYLRYADFFTYNWDLGINMQMLYSTLHGHLLYETADFQTMGVGTFLEVHSGYIAYFIAYIYAIEPIATTLFIIQSLVVSLSSIPLLMILKNVIKQRNLQYSVIFLFLFNFFIISSILYDFHWEAFVPVEFFTFFYLVINRRYKLSILIIILGALTLEVIPLLMAGLFAYLFLERVFINIYGKGVPLITDVKPIVSLILMTLSVVVFFIIEVIQLFILPRYFPVFSSKSTTAGPLYSAFSLHFFGTQYFTVLTYWLAILFSLGFISIFNKRLILISLPWLIFTFFISPYYGSFIGYQYGFIALPPIFISFIYGLRKMVSGDESSTKHINTSIVKYSLLLFYLTFSALFIFMSFIYKNTGLILSLSQYSIFLSFVTFVFPLAIIFSMKITRSTKGRIKISRLKNNSIFNGILFFIAVLILVNISLSPLNTQNFQKTPMPGYSFLYYENPASSSMGQLISYMPTNSTVVASDNLFPYVANNLNSYSFMWYRNESVSRFFPFNSTHLPEYLLVDDYQFGFIPNYISKLMFTPQGYETVAYINNSGYPGNIYLLKLGYTGIQIKI